MSSELPPVETADQRTKLWKEIGEAGGAEAYITQALRDRGLLVEGQDPASMSKKARGVYKKAKRAEGEARKSLRQRVWAAYRETHLVHLGEGVFYNDLVDIDKFDIDKREQRRDANDIPPIETVDALAEFFGIPLPKMRWLAYHRHADTGSHYARFAIPKSDGSERIISAPKPLLKACQRKIYREILEQLPVHGGAHGFVPGRSIATHAQHHAGAQVIIKLDLKDFFPTVVMPRVKGFFRKIGLPEQVATVLALICTDSPREEVEHNGKNYHVALGPRSLPQGAPTSPTLTNLICHRMDRRLNGLARKYNWRYSRYADDIAFSWHHTDSEPNIGTILGFGRQIIEGEGFKVHPKKLRIIRSRSRQLLTGLVINALPGDQPQRARVPRKLTRQVRAAIFNHQQGRPTKEGESLEQLRGLAAFIHQSNPAKGRVFLDQIQALIQKREETAL